MFRNYAHIKQFLKNPNYHLHAYRLKVLAQLRLQPIGAHWNVKTYKVQIPTNKNLHARSDVTFQNIQSLNQPADIANL